MFGIPVLVDVIQVDLYALAASGVSQCDAVGVGQKFLNAPTIIGLGHAPTIFAYSTCLGSETKISIQVLTHHANVHGSPAYCPTVSIWTGTMHSE
ncbi:MAG: hypothetical protein KAW17_02140 [Candidatus Eisenbacteria sp.]|nr:hypothetical protein [Candidatus Eisenbacteria bacterium]